MVTKHYDVIIIGGGAAGLFCAFTAGQRGRRVLLLEHNASVGKKIRISGGGRCNFTNLYAAPSNYLSDNPHFCKSALARYTPQDFIALVEKYGIAYHEKTLGQLFCDGSAQQIIDLLLEECRRAGVTVCCGVKVENLSRASYADGQSKLANSFAIQTNQGIFNCQAAVIATGGLSIPTLGATNFAYRIARQFGIKIIPPRPVLAPLVIKAENFAAFRALSGLAVTAQVECGDAEFSENILFTHRGLSGPAILQVSSYWRRGAKIVINLLPRATEVEQLAAQRGREVELVNALATVLPRRLAQAWCTVNAPSRPLKNYSVKEWTRIIAQLQAWQLAPDDTEGYRKAEVTAGGIDTRELSSQTMASKKVEGLYFIGEATDVTGWLGGYNFQWAWASGYAAGLDV